MTNDRIDEKEENPFHTGRIAYIKPTGSSGDGSQQVIRPEGGNRVPGLLGGERPQPA